MKKESQTQKNIPYQFDKELRFKIKDNFFKSVEGLSVKEIEGILSDISHELSSFKGNICYDIELSKKISSQTH